MKRKRRKFTPAFKAKVAIEALKERQTLSELAERFECKRPSNPILPTFWSLLIFVAIKTTTDAAHTRSD